jgi:hypothetical protein
MFTRDAFLEFSGMTLTSFRLDWHQLPGGGMSDDLLYHMFQTGLFDFIRVQDPWSREARIYNRVDMQRYVTERDRLEIRRLQAEIKTLKEAADAKRSLPVADSGPVAVGRGPGVGDPVRESKKE